MFCIVCWVPILQVLIYDIQICVHIPGRGILQTVFVDTISKLAHHGNDSKWQTLAQSRKIVLIYALFKSYTEEWAWKARDDRLQRPCYLSRVDHDRKIRSRKQRTDIEKYSFVNRSIQL
jgi:hypothetical protein